MRNAYITCLDPCLCLQLPVQFIAHFGQLGHEVGLSEHPQNTSRTPRGVTCHSVVIKYMYCHEMMKCNASLANT